MRLKLLKNKIDFNDVGDDIHIIIYIIYIIIYIIYIIITSLVAQRSSVSGP